MLSDLAHDATREAIFRAEREASRADVGAAAVEAEDRDWETTLGDGIG